MKVTTICMADYANMTAEGKLNVLGIFNIINCLKFPSVHRHAVLVVSLLFEMADHAPHAPETVPCEVMIVNPDGRALLKVTVPIKVRPDRDHANLMLELNDLPLECAGQHEVRVKLGEDESAMVPMVVTKRA